MNGHSEEYKRSNIFCGDQAMQATNTAYAAYDWAPGGHARACNNRSTELPLFNTATAPYRLRKTGALRFDRLIFPTLHLRIWTACLGLICLALTAAIASALFQ